MTKHIVPQYKLMMFYDLAASETEAYLQFVMNEMIPVLQERGLYIFRVFHTIPGQTNPDQRLRQIEYVAEDLETIRTVLSSAEWQTLEARLLEYALNYQRKIVRFRQGFQM